MKVTVCKIDRTYNLGNYESLKLGFEANLNDTDQPLQVAQDLELLINQAYENRRKPVAAPVQPAPATPKASPFKRVEPKLSGDTSKDGDTCPTCNGKKKPGYTQCYHCYEEEKAQ